MKSYKKRLQSRKFQTRKAITQIIPNKINPTLLDITLFYLKSTPVQFFKSEANVQIRIMIS